MLSNYYDINNKPEFEELFGDLYIGKNPTPKKTSYFMLRLDFSNIATDKGKLSLIDSFEKSVIDSVKDFINKYEPILNFSNDKQEINFRYEAIL